MTIERCWNAGMTLSQAWRFLERRGFTDKMGLVSRWRQLKQELGVSCVKHKTLPPTERELNQDVGGMTYGDWLGVTGPGKNLREICNEAHD